MSNYWFVFVCLLLLTISVDAYGQEKACPIAPDWIEIPTVVHAFYRRINYFDYVDEKRAARVIKKLNKYFAPSRIKFVKKNFCEYPTDNILSSAVKVDTSRIREWGEKYRVGNSGVLNIFVVPLLYTKGPKLINGKAPNVLFRPDNEAYAKFDSVLVSTSIFKETHHSRRELKTLAHEIGHWLDLYHVFRTKGKCGPGDEVGDTPDQKDSRSGQTLKDYMRRKWKKKSYPSDTCKDDKGSDPVRNLMNYTADDLRSVFSKGQSERMCRGYAKRLPPSENFNCPNEMVSIEVANTFELSLSKLIAVCSRPSGEVAIAIGDDSRQLTAEGFICLALGDESKLDVKAKLANFSFSDYLMVTEAKLALGLQSILKELDFIVPPIGDMRLPKYIDRIASLNSERAKWIK